MLSRLNCKPNQMPFFSVVHLRTKTTKWVKYICKKWIKRMFLQLKWSVFEWFSRGFMIPNKFMNLMMDSLVRVSFPLRTIDPLFFPVLILADEVASVKLNRSSKIGVFVINGYWSINFAMSATKNGFFFMRTIR